jgi:hypothetical protein
VNGENGSRKTGGGNGGKTGLDFWNPLNSLEPVTGYGVRCAPRVRHGNQGQVAVTGLVFRLMPWPVRSHAHQGTQRLDLFPVPDHDVQKQAARIE